MARAFVRQVTTTTTLSFIGPSCVFHGCEVRKKGEDTGWSTTEEGKLHRKERGLELEEAVFVETLPPPRVEF